MTSMQEQPAIKWQTPPPGASDGRGKPGKWAAIAAALRARPGEWALVAESVSRSFPTQLRRGALPPAEFEMTSRGSFGDKVALYARYIGGQS